MFWFFLEVIFDHMQIQYLGIFKILYTANLPLQREISESLISKLFPQYPLLIIWNWNLELGGSNQQGCDSESGCFDRSGTVFWKGRIRSENPDHESLLNFTIHTIFIEFIDFSFKRSQFFLWIFHRYSKRYNFLL